MPPASHRDTHVRTGGDETLLRGDASSLSSSEECEEATWLSEVGRLLTKRFPLHSYGVAIATTFASQWMLFDAAEGRLTLSLAIAPRILTFLCLFLALRLADDLYDLEDDAAQGSWSPQLLSLRRSCLLGGLLCAVAVAVLCNESGLRLLALGAIAGAVLVPLAAQRLGASRYVGTQRSLTTGSAWKDAITAVGYEGTNLLVIAYVYFAWADTNTASVPLAIGVATVLAYWASYEFWKYSRYLVKPRWQPYGLSWPKARVALLLALLVVVAAQGILAWRGPLPGWFIVATWPGALAAALVLITSEPGGAYSKPRRLCHALVGLAFIAYFNVTVLVGLLAG